MSPLAMRRRIFLMRFKVNTGHLGLKTMFARRPPDILFCICRIGAILWGTLLFDISTIRNDYNTVATMKK